MNSTAKQFLAGLLGGLMASGTATVTVLQETAFNAVTTGQWTVIGLGGALATFSAWRTLLVESPKR